MTRTSERFTLAQFLAFAIVVSAISFEHAHAQATSADPDWPCVQRLLPEIAGGMVWAGPPLDDAALPEDDRTFTDLSKELAARPT